MKNLNQTIDQLQDVLAICSCCGNIFRVVEGKFVFPSKPIKKSEYSSILEKELSVQRAEQKLDAAEERFRILLEQQKETLAKAGRDSAKKKLKKIDPVFSGRGVDPQEVKAVFDPIEYIVFHGMHSANRVFEIELISRKPQTKRSENIVKSIDSVVKKGNVVFETLQMKDDGTFVIKKVV